MKHLLCAIAIAAAAVASADVYDIKPTADGAGLEAVKWENKYDKELKAATSEEALASFVTDEAAAMKLLNNLQGAYLTDAMAITVIAAVSQYVMLDDPWYCFWSKPHEDGRDVWTEALLKKAETAEDSYIKVFCLDQLRWCGTPEQMPRIAAIGFKAKDKSVKEFADWVNRELARL